MNNQCCKRCENLHWVENKGCDCPCHTQEPKCLVGSHRGACIVSAIGVCKNCAPFYPPTQEPQSVKGYTKTCLGLDCPERKSLCCGVGCTNGKSGEPRFVCIKCRKEFVGGKCTAGSKSSDEITQEPQSVPWEEEWLEYVRTYVVRHCSPIEEWKMISIAGNLQQVVKSILAQERQALVDAINKRKVDVIVNEVAWNEQGRREGNWELGYDDATTDAIDLLEHLKKQI